jgi:hypothetical protein
MTSGYTFPREWGTLINTMYPTPNPLIVYFCGSLAVLTILLISGCQNPQTPLGIARAETLAEQGFTATNEKERVYLRLKTENLALKTKGVESVKGISLSWDSANKVTAMADVQIQSQSRVLTFVFRRFFPTPASASQGQGEPVPYWREMPEEVSAASPPSP